MPLQVSDSHTLSFDGCSALEGVRGVSEGCQRGFKCVRNTFWIESAIEESAMVWLIVFQWGRVRDKRLRASDSLESSE